MRRTGAEIGHTVRNPGLVFVLLDQSGSMNDDWNREGMSKIDKAKELLDRCIRDIASGSSDGSTGYLPRTFLMVFGYTGTGDPDHLLVPLLGSGWVRELIEFDAEGPWVNAAAYDRTETPMERTFDKLRSVIEHLFADPQVARALRHSMGPTVINITDGEPYRLGRTWESMRHATEDAAQRLMEVATPSGSPLLLFNAHIGHGEEIVYPTGKRRGMDRFSELLFDISSSIPPEMQEFGAQRIVELREEGQHAGLIVNATSARVMELLNMGSYTNYGRRR